MTLYQEKLWVEDHKEIIIKSVKHSKNVLGLFQLPVCWITLPYYRDDEYRKIKRGGVTISG